MRTAVQRTQRKAKAEPLIPAIDHPGRKLVPVAYLAGIAVLVSSSFSGMVYGSMDALPAILMPWAGFYWGKLFFWRGMVN